MQARSSFGIYNGLSVITIDDEGQQKIIGLCTDVNSHHLISALLSDPQFFQQKVASVFKIG